MRSRVVRGARYDIARWERETPPFGTVLTALFCANVVVVSNDSPAQPRVARTVALLGWAAVGLLDLWAGVDVFTSSGRASDTTQIVDQLGNDSVVDTKYVSQPDLIALIVGVLVVGAVGARWFLQGGVWWPRLRRLLVALGLASVVVLAVGGHLYAMLVPVCVLVGAGADLIERRPSERDEPTVAPRPRPRPSQVAARRPSPSPRA